MVSLLQAGWFVVVRFIARSEITELNSESASKRADQRMERGQLQITCNVNMVLCSCDCCFSARAIQVWGICSEVAFVPG